MTGIWRPISTAPRDGTPVVFWTDDDGEPPVCPMTVGYWVANPVTGLGSWRLFGDPLRVCSDRQIRGWKPLLRG